MALLGVTSEVRALARRSPQGEGVAATRAGAATSIAVTTIARGSNSGIEMRQEVVVRTGEEWRKLWSTHASGETTPPVVDFSKEVVAAVFLGTRPTGGFGVEIVRARREGDAVVVEYVERRPDPGLLVTQALTAPFHIVRLPRHDGAVRFQRIEK